MKTKLKVFIFCSFLLFSGALIAPKVSTQTQTETAGQKFKSIKVLNDMPADQMGKVMNMMAASLGVNCKFCHASNDGDYEKEGFEHKDIARNMLKMTFDLNKNYFDGRPEINCNSCHQGKAHPGDGPLMPVEQAPRPFSPKTTIEEILAKYETALGGKANLAKITSREIKAQRIEPDGKTFEDEEVLQKADKMTVATKYGDYVVTEGFDGKTAWKRGNNDEIKLKSDEIEQIKREAQLFANADLAKIYSKLDHRFMDKIDGRDVYLVTATTADNQREDSFADRLARPPHRFDKNCPREFPVSG